MEKTIWNVKLEMGPRSGHQLFHIPHSTLQKNMEALGLTIN